MTVTTEHYYTGNNSTTSYAYTFPYYQTSDIKVTWDGALKTESTHYNVSGTNIVFTSGNVPGNGVVIRIYRETDVDTSKATFAPGSSIRATDLNNQGTQVLYAAQEEQGQQIITGEIKDGAITSAKILDGTIATADIADDAITAAKIGTNAIDATNLAANSVGASELADNAVDTAAIVDDAVTSAKVATGAVVADGLASNAVTTAKLATGAVTADEIGSSAVTTAKIDNSAVTAAKIGTDAVTTAKILDANVTTNKIANDAVTIDKIADNAVDSQHYVDGSIDTAHIADNAITAAKFGSNVITNAKLADDSVGTAEIIDANVTTAKIADNAVTMAKIGAGALPTDITVASANLIDGTIATADIADNAVTTAKIPDNAVTTAKIPNNAITTAKIAADAVQEDQLADSAVTRDRIANSAVTNPKIETNAVDTGKLQDGCVINQKLGADAVTGAKIADDAIDSEHITDNAVTTAKIADAELTTLAGMQSGTASILAGSTALTSTLTELNLLDGKSVVTSVSGSSTDVQLPTAKAVNDQIVALMQDAGGYFPIADDQSFPNANPDPNDDAGTIVSIADAGGLVVNGSGVTTTGRTLGGSTVTINGIDSSLYSTTIAAGKGMLVQTTSTLNTYTYHRLVVDEAGVATAQTLVSDFNERYRVGSSNPSSNNDDGDLFFNTSSDKMLVYNATGNSWDEVQSIGNFYIATFSEAFDGSRTAFTVSNAPTNAQQLLISINGVVQKPNAGTGAPSEGFTLSSSTVTFSSAPATGSDSFIVVIGSTVNIGTPSDNTVDADILQNGAVTTTKIADDAVTGAKIANDAVGAEHIEVLDANLQFADGVHAKFGTGDDLAIYHYPDHNYIDSSNGRIYLRHGTDAAVVTWPNAQVELYYDNSKKFETTSVGSKIQGNLVLENTSQSKILSHTADGSDDNWLSINGGGDASQTRGGGVTCFGNEATDNQGKINIAGGNSGSANGTIDFSTGGSLRARLTNDGHFTIPNDSSKLKLGASNDLQIYHNGTSNYIQSPNSHAQYIDSNLIIFRNGDGSEQLAQWQANAESSLFYDNVKKIETTSTGVTVSGSDTTGTIVKGAFAFRDVSSSSNRIEWIPASPYGLRWGDNYKAIFGSGNDLQIHHNGTNSFINNSTGELQFQCNDVRFYTDGASETHAKFIHNAAVELYHNNIKTFQTSTNGIQVFGPEGGNATQYFYADEGDDNADEWGLIAHSSSSKFSIDNYAGGGWETSLTCEGNGAAKLFYDDSMKLETSANGIKVYNRIGVNITPTTALQFLDHSGSYEGRASWGNSADLQIYHNGTDSRIINAGSDLYLYTTGDHDVKILADSQNAVICKPDGAVELYYDNSKKLETIPEGIKITAGAENEEALVQVAYSTVPTNLSSSFDGTWGESFFSINKWRNSDGSSSWSASNNASYASAAIGLSGNTSSSVIQMYTAASPNTDPTSKFEVWSDGTANIVDGNLKVASGHGIDFSAHGNAGGMSSEVLHDYEEGTWTPTYRGTSTAGSTTHTTQVGHYVKVGSLVTLFFYVVWSSQNGGGHGCIGGLPWTGKSGSYSTGALMWNNISIDSNRTNVVTHQSGNSNVLYLYGSGVNNAWDSMPLDSAGNIIGQITYTI